MIALPDRPKILVVALRRIGDVLLTTPLTHSLHRAWPEASIDMLVFADTAGILDGNPDVDYVITMPQRANFLASVGMAGRLFKRYDLAISTQSGDRPTFFAALAGRTRVGLAAGEDAMSRFKKSLLNVAVPIQTGVHRVDETLRLADALGIERAARTVCPAGAIAQDTTPKAPYAVLHPAPMYRYKRWHDEGWKEVTRGLAARGLHVVVTGGPASDERDYLDTLFGDDIQVRRVDGKLTWPQLAALMAGARVFIGTDTSVTHLAAASGVPTVALYGPTDPRLWGPWPVDGLLEPWHAAGTIQHRGNVWLVQNPLSCLPCQQEGCDRHLNSHSLCMDGLSTRQVLAAVDQALRNPTAKSGESA